MFSRVPALFNVYTGKEARRTFPLFLIFFVNKQQPTQKLCYFDCCILTLIEHTCNDKKIKCGLKFSLVQYLQLSQRCQPETI